MNKVITWVIALAILGFFCGSYINYLVKQSKPKITVTI